MPRMRLDKLLSHLNCGSRREVQAMIRSGRVTVDGAMETDPAAKVDPDAAQVALDGQAQCYRAQRYYMLNKPSGVITASRDERHDTVLDLFPEEERRGLFAVGRLDKDSSGLILLTNDGDFGFQMTHPKFAKHKLYEVELERALEPLHQQMIGDFGVELKDGRSRLGLTKLDEGRRKWLVEMSEGRNRQIRRTFGALGYTVTGLKRLEFGPYRLAGLAPGEWVELPQPKKA